VYLLLTAVVDGHPLGIKNLEEFSTWDQFC
jgi:hypothetical protein